MSQLEWIAVLQKCVFAVQNQNRNWTLKKGGLLDF